MSFSNTKGIIYFFKEFRIKLKFNAVYLVWSGQSFLLKLPNTPSLKTALRSTNMKTTSFMMRINSTCVEGKPSDPQHCVQPWATRQRQVSSRRLGLVNKTCSGSEVYTCLEGSLRKTSAVETKGKRWRIPIEWGTYSGLLQIKKKISGISQLSYLACEEESKVRHQEWPHHLKLRGGKEC